MSTAVQSAALEFADFLDGQGPRVPAFITVALLLSVRGHRSAGAPLKLARQLNKLSRKMVGKLNTAARAGGLQYDPFEIVEFSSFDGLLKVRPKSGQPWRDILLVTHATGEQSPIFAGGIFFGPEVFIINGSGINDLLDAINAPKRRKIIPKFRARFLREGTLTIVACGVGATGPDVAQYVRELFGTEGRIRFPLVNVDFFADGSLGTPKDPTATPPWALRPLRDDEWRELPSKDEALDRPPVRP
jgi:hypothetical protein